MNIKIWTTSFLYACLACFHTVSAQELILDNYIYDPNIYTPQLYRAPYEDAYPILELGTNKSLVLEFDEFIPQDERESEFMVDIISCDAQWKPSRLLPIEYYQGFTQNRITHFTRSEFTKVPYIHYAYQFPKQGEGFKMSGNYVLKVYRDNRKQELVVTRRFVVVEKVVSLYPKYDLNPSPNRLELRELAFDVVTKNLNQPNPLRDIKLVVLQNFRWDNAHSVGQPRFFREQEFEYYVDLNLAFQGGNEFRRHDIRSVRFGSESVQRIEERDEVYDIFLRPEKPRSSNFIRSVRDFNGAFLIYTQEWPSEPEYRADYVYNFFSLQAPAQDAEIYVFGALSDWQIKKPYQLNYNDNLHRYEADILLKQGVYDYIYVVAENGKIDEQALEGTHLESENFYSVFVYYRSPTDRNDRLVGYLPINYVE